MIQDDYKNIKFLELSINEEKVNYRSCKITIYWPMNRKVKLRNKYKMVRYTSHEPQDAKFSFAKICYTLLIINIA